MRSYDTSQTQMYRNVDAKYVCLFKSLNQIYSAETHAVQLQHTHTHVSEPLIFRCKTFMFILHLRNERSAYSFSFLLNDE
jgi:hypothetical protein